MNFSGWIKRLWEKLAPGRRVQIIEGDSLPVRLPRRNLVLARDEGEDWCVGMRCPCSCGETIELLLIAEANPRWDLMIDRSGRPTLSPSVWRKSGCHSHFWLRNGKVQWCE